MDIAGSAVGIASLGIQVCQGLLQFYGSWRSYQPDIERAYEAIEDLITTLDLLKSSLERHDLDEDRSKRVEKGLDSCVDSINELSETLQKLRKHETPKGFRQNVLSELQKLQYPFREKTLAKIQQNVRSVQGRLSLALQVLQLDVCATSSAMQRSDQFRRIYEWLSPPDPSTNHESARRRHQPGTGEWLLQCDEYRKWKAGTVQHLWMYGKAGCGKTVLCSTAIEDINTHCQVKENTTYACFYFTFSDSHKQTYSNLIRSLLAQIGWKEPGLSILRRVYETGSRSLPGVDELEKILLSLLEAHDHVIFLLDALDECPEKDGIRQDVLERVECLARRTVKLKILTTSRELQDIRDSMIELEAEQLSIRTCVVDGDILKYVSNQLQHDRKLARFQLQPRAQIEKTLAEKSDGMFRWVFCQLEELKTLPDVRPSYVRKALSNLPRTLDETYTRMLTAIGQDYHKDALTLLRWITYARYPPTLSQLVDAVTINASEDTVDLEDRGNLEGPLKMLGNLVTTTEPEFVLGRNAAISQDSDEDRNGDESDSDLQSYRPKNYSDQNTGDGLEFGPYTKVRLAHFSVKEYLVSSRILDGPAKDFYLEDAISHHFLAQSCLSYIIHYSQSSDKTLSKDDLLTFPLIKYAAQNWNYHSSLQKDGDITSQISLLKSEDTKRAWLTVHEPDQSWRKSFEDVQSIGSALYYASFLSLEAATRLLLKEGADINAQGGFHGNALQAASCRGNIEIVKVLLENGAEVNTQGGGFSNALQEASYEGHIEIVNLLLENGAEVNIQGGSYGNALQATSLRGYIEIVKVLLEKGAEVNVQGGEFGNALQAASYQGDVEIVKLLLENGAEVNVQGGYYGNALQAAMEYQYTEIVDLLLEAGADLTTVDEVTAHEYYQRTSARKRKAPDS